MNILYRWFIDRLARTDSLTLTQRNVYIVPTGPGFMLVITLLVLLVGAINYQLNLGYLLTFLLAGCALIGMHVGHDSLRGLSLKLSPPPACFVGSTADIEIHLGSQRRRVRYGIGLALLDSGQWVWCDVPAQGSARLQLTFKPARRGLHRLPTLTAETRFPLGMFRVWCVWRPAAKVLVYPAPEHSPPPLPAGESQAGPVGNAPVNSPSSGEFEGIRAYRRGDPPRLIVWKKAAQADELVSRDSAPPQGLTLWLAPAQTGSTQQEQQLSRLCAWVLQAEQQGFDYGLRLAGQIIGPDHGEVHKSHCLQALALCPQGH
ncbi:MAG: hypothetical protein ACI9I0_000058 [Rhodoferax sp.]|jgi:uncharacterized protein (DUF58 family)